MFKIITLSREALESKMATKPANKAQKQWMSDIADWASNNGMCLIYHGGWGKESSFQLHHVLGRSAKHNKVAIGHWFILPVPFDLHDVNSDHSMNVTHSKHNFTDAFGMQRELFDDMYKDMKNSYGYSLPPDDVYNAIMDTNA